MLPVLCYFYVPVCKCRVLWLLYLCVTSHALFIIILVIKKSLSIGVAHLAPTAPILVGCMISSSVGAVKGLVELYYSSSTWEEVWVKRFYLLLNT